MNGALTSFAVAVAITATIWYVLMTRAQNRRRRRRIEIAGGDYSSSNDGFILSNRFSSSHCCGDSALDSSGNPTEGGTCGDAGGSDAGGGGDGGGGD